MSENLQVCASEGSQAAGRDIHNHTLVVQQALPPPPTEEQLQHEFAQRTGIDCGKDARAWLQQLMEHHGFTVRELAAGWHANSLGWDKERHVPRVCTPWLEAVFAYGVIGVLGLWCLTLAVLAIWVGTDKLQVRMGVYAVALVYLGACWLVARFILWPRRVAQRVLRGGHDASAPCAAAHNDRLTQP